MWSRRSRMIGATVVVTALAATGFAVFDGVANANTQRAIASVRGRLRFDVCHVRSIADVELESAAIALEQAGRGNLPLEARMVAILEDIRRHDFLLAEGELTALSEVGASNGLVRLLSAYRNFEQRRFAAVLQDSGVAADLLVPEIEGGQLALLSLRLDAALAMSNTTLATRTLRELENRFADAHQCTAISFRRAQVADSDGDFPAAREEMLRAIDAGANDAASWLMLAQLDERLNLATDAREHYLRALRVSDTDSSVHAAFALFLAKSGDAATARQHATRATELDPTLASAWAARGEVARIDHDFEAAVAHLRTATESEPDNVTFVFKLAMAYAGKLDWQNASQLFARATELSPTLAAAHNGNGVARMELARQASNDAVELGAARASFERALELDPNDPNPARNLARLDAMRRG